MATQTLIPPANAFFGDLLLLTGGTGALTRIDSFLAGSAERYWASLSIYGSTGRVVLAFTNTSPAAPEAANEDLVPAFETNGILKVLHLHDEFTVELSGADLSEPYDWTPSNAADVISFFNDLVTLGSPVLGYSISLTLDTAPVAPTIANKTNQAGVSVGTVTLPQGSGGDPPLTYAVSGLPPGLSFDPGNRQVTGTPTMAGTYPVTYTVTDTAL